MTTKNLSLANTTGLDAERGRGCGERSEPASTRVVKPRLRRGRLSRRPPTTEDGAWNAATPSVPFAVAMENSGFWHVSLETGSGKSARMAIANDLSFDQVRAQVVEPWRAGRSFTVAGLLARSPDAVTAIRIVQTAEPLQVFVDAHEKRMDAQGIADFATKRRTLPFGAGDDRTNELLFSEVEIEGSVSMKRQVSGPASTVTLSILFMDLAGWSKLKTPQIATYLEKALPKLSDKIRAFHSTHLNTWGDAVVATFASAAAAANCALDVRDFFRRAAESDGVPRGLVPRVSLHLGEVIIATNPLLGKEDIFGEAVHLAARLEPVTARGQVFCTEALANALMAVAGTAPVAHPMGEVDLPKGFGQVKVFAVTGPNEDAPAAPANQGSPPAVATGEETKASPLGDDETAGLLRVFIRTLPAKSVNLTYAQVIAKCHPRVDIEHIKRLLPTVLQGTNWRATVGEETVALEFHMPGPVVISNPRRGF
jgi:class 3 adenylate cyclase